MIPVPANLELKFFNSRDVEVPMLSSFLNQCAAGIETLLDVGAHASCDAYAPALMKFMEERTAYHAIDILPDPRTAQMVDQWYTGNFNNFTVNPPQYDCVICISAIEHAGITTYKAEGNPARERALLMIKLLKASRRYVFLTFPFGSEGGTPGQYQNITEKELQVYEQFAKADGFAPLFQEFFFNPAPQEKHPWKSVSKHECADVAYNPRIEQQTVACVAWGK